VESSIKWTGDLSPLETVIGTKNFSIAQNANLLAGEKIALFLRKDGEQFPVMVDSSEQNTNASKITIISVSYQMIGML